MSRCAVKTAVLAALLLLNSSCRDSFQVFSNKYHVLFRCDISMSPYTPVQTYGSFVSVRQSGNNLKVTDMNGTTTQLQMSQVESAGISLGLGGLIIGIPSIGNTDGLIYAYDLACPVCDRASARLSFDNLGIAECKSCNTVFDLNNNGFVIGSGSGGNHPLYRYPVSRSGSMVIVSN